MISYRKRLRRGLWHLPNRILETRGDFLGEESDRFIDVLAWARSALGLLILAGIALSYPGFTKPMAELISTGGNVPPDAVIASKFLDTWLTQVLVGFLIALVFIVLFAVLMLVLTRSNSRLLMLRHLCQPLIAFALFAGLMGILVGVIDLENWLISSAYQTLSDSGSSAGTRAVAVVEFLVLAVVFVGSLPTLVVLYVKSIYLAAVDVFRADDAHPLLAPLATTVIAWSLASSTVIAGWPTGVSHGLGWLIVFTGPLTVSIINAVACCRLWWKHHDLLFRSGPLAPGRKTPLTTTRLPGSVRVQFGAITGTVFAVGLIAFGVVYFGNKLITAPQTFGPVSLRWSYTTGNFVDSPVAAGGTVYIGSDDAKVYALDAATGDLRWSYTTRAAVESSPAVVGGTVYIGSNDDRVYALDAATGRLRWTYATGSEVVSSPAVVGGTVYVGSDDGKVYALDAATGRLRWTYTTGAAIYSSPAVAGGTVYVGSFDDNVYALNAATGRLRWTYTTRGAIDADPAVAGDTVYVGSNDDNVYALNAATGRLRWTYATGGAIHSSPAVAGGTVYVGSNDDNVYALNAATGRLRWTYATGGAVESSPALADGTVCIGSFDGNVYGLNAATGRLRWSYDTGYYVYSRPAVAGNSAYVGSTDYHVYAFNTAG
jgi:outer membrane protein assembly factor BamB